MKLLLEIFPFKLKKKKIRYLFLKKFNKFYKISIVFKNKNNRNFNYFFLFYLLKIKKKIIFHYNLTINLFLFFKDLYVINNNSLNRFLLLKGDKNKIIKFNFYKFYNFFKKNNIYLTLYPEYFKNSYLNSKSKIYIRRKIFFFKAKSIITQHLNFSESLLLYKLKINSIFLIPGFFVFKDISELINSFNNCGIQVPYCFIKYFYEYKNIFSRIYIFLLYNNIKNILIKKIKIITFFSLNNFIFFKNFLKKLFKNG
ncbi:hypothetical protein ACWNYQ_00290 [Candidatus Vidania fulgoroideorum]